MTVTIQARKITDIADDNVLDTGEKAQIKQTYSAIVANKPSLLSKAAAYKVSSDNYVSAFNTLTSYLASLSPAWNDTTANTPIARADFDAVWSLEFVAREQLARAIADATAKLANWTGVEGKPDDLLEFDPIAGQKVESVAWNADVTRDNTAKDTANVGGRPSNQIVTGIDNLRTDVDRALTAAQAQADKEIAAATPPSSVTGLDWFNILTDAGADVTLTWTGATGATSYEVEISENGGGGIVFAAPSTSYRFAGKRNTSYTARVRALKVNVAGAWVSAADYATGRDTVGPAAPTGLSVDPGITWVDVSLFAPADADQAKVQINLKRADGTIIDFAKIDATAGTRVQRRFSELARAASYSVVAVAFDSSDNISPATAEVAFKTTDGYAAGDLTPDASVIKTVTALPATATDAKFVYYNGSLYRWTGSTWTKSVNGGDIVGGTVTGAAIATATLGEEKLVPASITATSLAPLAVTADKIGTGAIATDKIRDDAINTDKILAGAVTEAKIQNGAVTEVKITDQAITAPKIRANAITADKIDAGAVTARALAIGNFDNIIPDGQMMDRSFWNSYVGVGSPNFALEDQGGSWSFGRRLRINPSEFGNWSTRFFPIEIGATYKLTYSLWVSSDFTGWFRPVLHQPGIRWLAIKTGSASGLDNYADAWTDSKGVVQRIDDRDIIFTVPGEATNSTRQTQFRFDGSITAGYVEFMVKIVRVSDSTLIKDGAITTDKIVANAITADKIQAGAITIGANGQLGGAGSGQVTIGGLGYTGDLNATRGAVAGVNLNDSAGVLMSDADVRNNVDGIIRAPQGGYRATTNPVETGAICIGLPAGWSSTMMKFTVDIFEYLAGYSCTMEISGYNYSQGFWDNCTARVIGNSNVEYPVKFGTTPDGSYCAVYIGNNNETWSYPQIRVRDVLVGYANYGRTLWQSGWNISFANATNISVTVADTLPGADYSKGKNNPTTLAAINAGESNKLGGIQDNATRGAPSGTNVGTIDAGLLDSRVYTATMSQDTRNDNQAPQYYIDRSNISRVFNEFKYLGVMGIPNPNGDNGSYGQLTTTLPWGDLSGGPIHQEIRDEQGRYWNRRSTSASSWAAWTDTGGQINYGVTTINGGKITTGSVTALQIAANTITSDKIAANTITANRLTVATRPFSIFGMQFRVDNDTVLRWNGGYVQYVNSLGNYVSEYTAGGATAPQNNSAQYLYFSPGSGEIGVTTSESIQGNPNVFFVGKWHNNKSGLNLSSGVGTLINGDQIVTGSITASQIAANAITADRIQTGAITIGSDGRLGGAGSGQVTIGGLGYTGALNASYGAIAGVNLTDSAGVTLRDGDVRNNQDGIIRNPVGGYRPTENSIETGAICIQLPNGWTSTMMKFTVDIYEYAAGYSCSIEVSGYNSDPWRNCTARVLGGSNVEYPVRFGVTPDGSYCAVYIGDANDTWSYPQIRVKDVMVGYVNYQRSRWESGWAIFFAAPTGISAEILDTLPGADYSKGKNNPQTLSAINGSEGAKLGGIAPGATVGAPAGTMIGNTEAQTVANNAASGAQDPATRINFGVTTVNGGMITTGSITAYQIAANTITGDKIVAGTISAAQIATGAITARTLATGNPDSIVPDSNFNDPKWWGQGDGRFGNGSIGFSQFQQAITIAPAGGIDAYSYFFPVERGATYKITTQIYSGDISGNFMPFIHMPGYEYWALKRDGGDFTSPRDSYGPEYTYTFTNPDIETCRQWQFRFSGSWTGTVYFACKIVRVSDTTLIKDGSITTDKIVVNSLNGDRIAAGTLTADKITAGSITTDRLSVGVQSKVLNNLLNTSFWGRSWSEAQTGWVQNNSAANQWTIGISPSGGSEKMLKMVASGGADNGGWNVNLTAADGWSRDKAYRYYTWVYAEDGANNSLYHGCDYIQGMQGGDIDNPYFLVFDKSNIAKQKWYLMVGYVHPANSGAGDSGLSGLYDPVTGQRVLAGSEYRWRPDAAQGVFRSYQYYGGDGGVAYFTKPVVEEVVAGQTPSIRSLFQNLDFAQNINTGLTQILPGMVNISGGTTLASWRDGGDTTKIAGGAISANSIRTNSLQVGDRGLNYIGLQFEYNAPNILKWSSGYVLWTDDAGNQQSSLIGANSWTWQGGSFNYVYWDKTNPNTLNAGADNWDTIRANPNQVLLCTWESSSPKFVANYGGTIVHGDNITTGTINANRITAGTVLASSVVIGGTSSTVSDVVSKANTAASDASSALSQINTLGDDNILTKSEKGALYTTYQDIDKRFVSARDASNAFVSSFGTDATGGQRNNAQADYNALVQYLLSLSPYWADVYSDSPVNGSQLRSLLINCYTSIGVLEAANLAAASARAQWNGVIGAGRPEDGATVGAIVGGNLRDTVGITINPGDIRNNEDGVIRNPAGGYRPSLSAAQIGAICIQLPMGWSSTMLKFTVDIYEYEAGYSCSIEVGGYNYSAGYWINCTARVIGGSNVEYPVRFGITPDGSRCAIYIGNANESWSYPQIRVKDVLVGYSNYARTQWESGWNIFFASPTGISAEVLDTLPGADYSKGKNNPQTLSAINGSEGAKLGGIAPGATVGAPAGTYIGNTEAQTVANNAAVGASDPAARINNYQTTTINGGRITTGSITADQIAANTIRVNNLVVGARAISSIGLVFEWNPSTNWVTWSDGYLYYQNDDGSVRAQYVNSGNTGGAAAHRFFYWIKDGGTIYHTQSEYEAFGTSDRVMLGSWWGGSNLNMTYGGTNINGNRITTGTVTANQIAAGTITGDRIAGNTITADKLQVNSLSAVSGTIGTLRTATSGGRMELSDNVIKIYDENGNLRAKIGNLSL